MFPGCSGHAWHQLPLLRDQYTALDWVADAEIKPRRGKNAKARKLHRLVPLATPPQSPNRARVEGVGTTTVPGSGQRSSKTSVFLLEKLFPVF